MIYGIIIVVAAIALMVVVKLLLQSDKHDMKENHVIEKREPRLGFELENTINHLSMDDDDFEDANDDVAAMNLKSEIEHDAESEEFNAYSDNAFSDDASLLAASSCEDSAIDDENVEFITSSDETQKQQTENIGSENIQQSARPKREEYIMLYLKADNNRPYMGYELLQALLSADLRYGDEMSIFHRYENTDGKDEILFSLAAGTKEGTFEINNMGAFVCHGLVMFMHLDGNKHLLHSFDSMIDTAKQLVDDLGGTLFNEKQQEITPEIINALRNKINAARLSSD